MELLPRRPRRAPELDLLQFRESLLLFLAQSVLLAIWRLLVLLSLKHQVQRHDGPEIGETRQNYDEPPDFGDNQHAENRRSKGANE